MAKIQPQKNTDLKFFFLPPHLEHLINMILIWMANLPIY
jgi:hypothetical protein